MQILKKALENESLVSKAQDTLVKEGLDKASEMFERWYCYGSSYVQTT